MQALKNYLRTLGRTDQESFARRAGTTIGYLRKAISTRQTIREKTCSRLEVESAGAVTRQELRPDDWRVIWPELVESEPKPTQTPTIQTQPAIKARALQEGVHA